MNITNIKKDQPTAKGLHRVWATIPGTNNAYIWINPDNSLADRAGTFKSDSNEESEIHDAFTSGKFQK